MCMKKIFFFFIAAALSSGCILAETPNVKFVNTGKMFIGGSANDFTVALYVPDDVRMVDANGNVPKVVMWPTENHSGNAGLCLLGGNFYQDSESNVFVKRYTTDSWIGGVVVFYGDRGERRYIKPLTRENIFDRSQSYVHFGLIFLGTNDTVVIPAKMGIDAAFLGNFDMDYFAGRFLFESKAFGTASNEKVFDASFRPITTSSDDCVTKGSVIVEKWVDTYRGGDQLFGFASPFKNQKSGYFAGNWVRKPEQIASDNKHTMYVYGNKPSAANPSVIAMDQYVRDPSIALEPGQAYLIKPRPAGYDYSQLQANGGLPITGAPASAYDKEKFVFDGKVYTLPSYQEQLFADKHLPVYKLNTPTGDKTTNWLMGNSYTCAISIQAIVDSIRASNIGFSRSMYVFPFGSQTYQEVKLVDDANAILTWQADEIPAMSIFMLRLNKNQGTGTTAGAEFKLGKSALVHSLVDHGQTPFSAPGSRLNNQVIFRLTTEDNENNFDLAAIGLRANSVLGGDNNDVQKVYMSDNAGFQLYTLAAPDANNNQAKLSANGVPLNVEQVSMNLKPMAHEPKTMILRVKGIETLSSESFWIEDLKTNTPHYFTNGEPYIFTTNPDDAQERFVVHFKAPKNDEEETGIIPGYASKLNMYSVGKKIFVENLLPSDLGADAAIYDIAGKLLDTFKITGAPEMSYTTNGLVDGTYVVRLYRISGAETLKLVIR